MDPGSDLLGTVPDLDGDAGRRRPSSWVTLRLAARILPPAFLMLACARGAYSLTYPGMLRTAISDTT